MSRAEFYRLPEGRNAIRRFTRALRSHSENDRSNFGDTLLENNDGGFFSDYDSTIFSNVSTESIHPGQDIPTADLPEETHLQEIPQRRVSARKQGNYNCNSFYLISYF